MFDYNVVLLEDHGSDPVTWPTERWAFGDVKAVKFIFVSADKTDLTGSIAALTVYDATGLLLFTTDMTVTISTAPDKCRATCVATVDASVAPFTLTGASYTMVLNFDTAGTETLIRNIRIPLTVEAVP